MSRFTISPSFSLLSLLPLSSLLDDPSRSLPPACLSVLRHGLLCSISFPPPTLCILHHGELHSSWLILFTFKSRPKRKNYLLTVKKKNPKKQLLDFYSTKTDKGS